MVSRKNLLGEPQANLITSDAEPENFLNTAVTILLLLDFFNPINLSVMIILDFINMLIITIINKVELDLINLSNCNLNLFLYYTKYSLLQIDYNEKLRL